MSTKKQSLLSKETVLCNIPAYKWRDEGWLRYRAASFAAGTRMPLNIYQVWLDGWKRDDGGARCPSAELASELACYVKQMGYTHVELLPSTLSPEEHMAFSDIMHEAGVGVIFALDPGAEDTMAEVFRCTLGYHADGLSLASELLDDICTFLEQTCPDVLVLSESAAAQKRTGVPCDRTWTEEVLAYFNDEPVFRKYRGGTLAERACGGHRLLSVSACDAARDGMSLLGRMPGEYAQKFANVRAFLTYMMTVPGKKRMFMGCEIGEFRPWEQDGAVEWFLLEHDAHASLQLFFAELNRLYLSCPSLWDDEDGFRLISDDREKSVLCYSRASEDGERLVIVVNISPVTLESYALCVPEAGEYEELINSDSLSFGGSGITNRGSLRAEQGPQGNFLRITVPPLAACIFRLAERRRASEDTLL